MKTVLMLIIFNGWQMSGVNDTVHTEMTTMTQCVEAKEIIEEKTSRGTVWCIE